MNKVITLNLQGNAFQLEETGYEALRAYLDTAARRLSGNPDKDEIIADIESAIADKFRAGLGPHKTVVLSGEVEQILAEMGPVEDASESTTPKTPAAATSAATGAGEPGAASPRRLFRIREGAMLGGVCNGLAAFTHIDVTIIRVGFALLMLTYGSGILVYLLLFFLLPLAETPAEKSAAFGGPSTAQEFIRRAKAGYYEGMKTLHDRRAHREWRRKFKRDMRDWRRGFRGEMRAAAEEMGDNWHRHWGQPEVLRPGAALPFLSLAKFVLTLLWLVATFSLISSGEVLGVALPPGIPLWIGLIFLFVAYRFLVWPLRAARYAYYGRSSYWPRPAPCHGWGDTLVGLGLLVVAVWMADRYVPEAHAALQNLPPAVHHAVASLREWWARR